MSDMKQQQLANLRSLREMWLQVNPETVDLATYKIENECGTHACLMGWACLSGRFSHIMKLVPMGGFAPGRWFPRQADYKGEITDYTELRWLDNHFGPGATHLFDPRDDENCEHDTLLIDMVGGAAYDDMGDWELALARIDLQIQLVTNE